MNDSSLEHFLTACGSSQPLQVGVGQRDQLASESRSFGQPFLVIGRRPESDLLLDHWQVSRRHAYLQLIEGRYFCVDLGSRTGTHGGDSTERSGWLEPGRAIQIGPFTVRPECPPREAAGGTAVPGVTWELPGRAIGQAVWKMDRQLVLIGRSPACRIRIVEPDVSKFHCSLVLTPMGVWVVDLLGQNGVFVNDKAVRCARLEDSDELRVGRHVLRPRYEAPVPALPLSALPLPEPSPEFPSVPGGLATIPPATGALGRIISTVPSPWPGPSRELASFVEQPVGLVDPTVAMMMHQFGMMQQQMFDQFHQSMMMMFEGFAALHREQSAALRDEFEEVRKLSREIEELRAETSRLARAAAPAERPRPAPNGHAPATPSPGRIPPAAGPARRPDPPMPNPEVDIHAQLCLRLASIQGERQNRWQKILGMMSNRD